jgi:cytidylate kinase/predicted transcriptional regulator
MPIITISRGICSGGTELAEMLHAKLGWPVLSQEEASAAAAKAYRMTEEELLRGLYLPANLYERFTQRKTRYLLATQAAITELLGDGDGIYHGLAGQFLFQDLCTAFKVRIVAPMALRVQTAMYRKSLTRDQANRYIRTADDHRLHWGRQIFDADVNDPDLYDLVVKLDQISLETAAGLIAEIMQGEDRQPTPQCIRDYQDFALCKRIEAELFFNSAFTPDMARVSVKNGEVRLTGDRSFEANRDRLIEFIGKIRGVTTIQTDDGAVNAVDFSPSSDFALSSKDAKASDVMLTLDQYPNCQGNCNIREAMVALSASAVKLEDGHFMLPRYLLIRNAENELVGVVGRRELLKALVPHLREDRESAEHIRALVPFGGSTPSEIFIRWTSLFSKAALEASKESVQSVMVPIRGAVQVDDSLSTVITTMLYHNIDLVAVLDGTKVAGVVLMTNIFDVVAQFVMEHGGVKGTGSERGGSDV